MNGFNMGKQAADVFTREVDWTSGDRDCMNLLSGYIKINLDNLEETASDVIGMADQVCDEPDKFMEAAAADAALEGDEDGNAKCLLDAIEEARDWLRGLRLVIADDAFDAGVRAWLADYASTR